MKNAMTYKGYAARIEFDAEDRIFFGRLTGIRDIVTFHGETVNELEAAFKEAVDDYLATCAKLGDEPNKPYSGKLTLRIPPTVHAAIATAAGNNFSSLLQSSCSRWRLRTSRQRAAPPNKALSCALSCLQKRWRAQLPLPTNFLYGYRSMSIALMSAR